MQSLTYKILLWFLVLTTFPVGLAHGTEIRLSAAASMTDVIKTLATLYQRDHPTVKILPNFGASGALVKQVIQGAPTDLFISANRQWMDYLLNAGQITPMTVQPFASNRLVFIGSPQLQITDLNQILGLKRIAIGSPRSVPAGQYAKQALTAAGLYQPLQQARKIVPAKDARQALMYADRGEVAGAFVYKTDGLSARQAVILLTVPEQLHEPIVYPIGLTPAGHKKAAVHAFYRFLLSPAAHTGLKKFSFSIPVPLAKSQQRPGPTRAIPGA